MPKRGKNRKRILAGAIALLLSHAGLLQAADKYPCRAARIIVPYPPGGGNDLMARMIAVPLGERFGIPVIVENKGGASTNIGAEAAVNAKPDGCTLFLGNLSMALNKSLFKLNYDIEKDLAPVIQTGAVPMLFFVNPSVRGDHDAEVPHARAPQSRKDDVLEHRPAGAGDAGIAQPEPARRWSSCRTRAPGRRWRPSCPAKFTVRRAPSRPRFPISTAEKCALWECSGRIARPAAGPAHAHRAGIARRRHDALVWNPRAGKDAGALVRQLSEEITAILARPESGERLHDRLGESAWHAGGLRS